jgi:hypothetical protein
VVEFSRRFDQQKIDPRIQTGPRQMLLPPKIDVVESPGS